jgi:hypothetical protein
MRTAQLAISLLVLTRLAHAQSIQNESTQTFPARDANTVLHERFDHTDAIQGAVRKYPIPTTLENEATIELRLRAQAYDVDLMTVGPDSSDADLGKLRVRLNADGKIALMISSNDASCTAGLESAAILPLDQPTDVAVSWGPALTKILVNGSPSALTSHTCFKPSSPAWAYFKSDGEVEAVRISSVQIADSVLAAQAAPTATLPTTIIASYSGKINLGCPLGSHAIIGSCNNGTNTVLSGPAPSRVWYLTPSSTGSTGLHCELDFSSTAMLRCAQ